MASIILIKDMETIEKNDVQGILVRGYTELPSACFLLLKIKSVISAKSWFRTNITRITPGDQKPLVVAANIAFTLSGLKTLDLDEEIVKTFSFEFQEGMDSPHKQFLLGDYGRSDPANWNWGNSKTDPIHVLLMLYAANNAVLDKHYLEIKSAGFEDAFQEILKLETKEITERKEHFGFHDGIAQPTIEGLGNRQDRKENTVAPGEFILGYKNEYGQFTDSPFVTTDKNHSSILPLSGQGKNQRDLGKNGSFLVFRQLQQDVQQFWDYMEAKTKNADGTADAYAMIEMASKIVGRWPSGTPMVLSPDKDNPDFENKNVFDYIPTDKEGLKCPFAAHVRRSNPRDAINRGDPTSIAVSKKHRLLRRGRSYGAPVAASMKPEDILKTSDRSGERGLYFICLNADLCRQFEFVQNFWINNPKFDGLYDERDPLTGNYSNPQDEKGTGTFGIPQEGIRARYTDVPEFVTLKGGSYFFLPGMKALQYITAI
jgi:Dyp-type peroxidase family